MGRYGSAAEDTRTGVAALKETQQMKRFHSKIESLRRVREQEERLARLQAAIRRHEKSVADQKLSEIHEQIAAAETKGISELADGRIEYVQSVSSTIRRLETEQQFARSEQAEAQQNLTLAIQQVAKAKTRLEITETHIEKERAEHRRQSRVEEENNRQENTAQRIARRQVTT